MRTTIRPILFTLALAAVLAACATPATQTRQVAVAEPPVERVFVYANAGQSETQLDRDRYECHRWAVKQSGFDPSAANPGTRQRIEVVAAPPPGTNTMGGALTGAIVGAAVSSPGSTGGGALVGAVAGAAIGATADNANQQHVKAEQQRYDQRYANATQRAVDYRRAIGACLEARSYTVK